MPVKISEKKLVIGSVCVAVAVLFLIKAPLITTPVYVSEKGMLLCIAAISLLALAILFFKQAIEKVS